jgi:hypothetical protein
MLFILAWMEEKTNSFFLDHNGLFSEMMRDKASMYILETRSNMCKT